MIAVHIVANVVGGEPVFGRGEQARDFWHRTRRAWPQALSACLMPTHLHLEVLVPNRRHASEKMGHLLSGVSRHLGRSRLFHPSKISKIADPRHAYRVSRYIHLNPCTDGLVEDPLVWLYTTYRGIVGAEVDPRVEAPRLAAAMGHRASACEFLARYHDYVTCGPDRCAPGSELPVAATPSEHPSRSLDSIVAATAAYGMWLGPKPRVRTAVLLARRQGWRETRRIAARLGLAPSQVRRLSLRRPGDERLLEPAALCLGDERLTRLE